MLQQTQYYKLLYFFFKNPYKLYLIGTAQKPVIRPLSGSRAQKCRFWGLVSGLSRDVAKILGIFRKNAEKIC